MVKLDFLDNYIEAVLLAENAEESAKHESSGKLSASSLGSPVQHQLLHVIGVSKDPLEEYVIRKFKRGRHVEDWLRAKMPGLLEEERDVEYKNVVGKIDAVIDMEMWNQKKLGILPHEIKSTSNAGFKWIKKTGAKRSHQLQACLYALAEDKSHFVIHYVATDDYRVESFLFKVSDFEKDVDSIVEEFDHYRKIGKVPAFEPKEKWQENIKYNNYSKWMDLTEEEIEIKLKEEFPESYKKLKEGIK